MLFCKTDENDELKEEGDDQGEMEDNVMHELVGSRTPDENQKPKNVNVTFSNISKLLPINESETFVSDNSCY